MKAGETIIIPLPNTSVDSHLWMVISDTDQDPQRIVMVNFTTWRADKDQACVVGPGEHPYLSHQSCVNFRDAKLVSAADIDSLVDSGQMKRHAPLSPELLARIRRAVAESRMNEGAAQFLIDQGLVDF